jgi:putative pyruvate formate lyase activating enzyme
MVRGLERYEGILAGEEKAKYLIAKELGLLKEKIEEARRVLQSCELCERKCGANRLKGERGFCGVGNEARIFGAHSHWGEEPTLVPSATLFFAGCTMRCVYCQNCPEAIHAEMGVVWSEERIAKWIEEKHLEGCKNVNFVGGEPTPFIYNILRALRLCNTNIPVVFNSNAYYSEKAASLLRDIVDVYLLDFRYFSEGCGVKLSAASGYPAAAKRNLLLAAGDAELLIRVLVMPSHIECDAKPIVKWIFENLGPDARLNIMAQYRPMWRVIQQPEKFAEIARPLGAREWRGVVEFARGLGLGNLVEF